MRRADLKLCPPLDYTEDVAQPCELNLQQPFKTDEVSENMGLDMLDTLGTLVANPILDLTLKIVGVAGFVVAVLAWKAARASVQATKASNITSLRMKAVESTAAAERSFVSLQSNYQSVSAAWQEHINKHHAPMSAFRYKPDELKRNAHVQREGENLMRKLEQNLDRLDQDGLERLIKEAQRTAIDIERLSFRLERPQSLRL